MGCKFPLCFEFSYNKNKRFQSGLSDALHCTYEQESVWVKKQMRSSQPSCKNRARPETALLRRDLEDLGDWFEWNALFSPSYDEYPKRTMIVYQSVHGSVGGFFNAGLSRVS
jgi:hypothetical protein